MNAIESEKSKIIQDLALLWSIEEFVKTIDFSNAYHLALYQEIYPFFIQKLGRRPNVNSNILHIQMK